VRRREDAYQYRVRLTELQSSIRAATVNFVIRPTDPSGDPNRIAATVRTAHLFQTQRSLAKETVCTSPASFVFESAPSSRHHIQAAPVLLLTRRTLSAPSPRLTE
jgi:hypothetical protein